MIARSLLVTLSAVALPLTLHADLLPCRIPCAEMVGIGVGQTQPSVQAGGAVQEALRHAQEEGKDAGAYWYWASQGFRYGGAAISGIDAGRLSGVAVSVLGEGMAHLSEIAMDAYTGRRIEHFGAAMDEALGGVLIGDGMITHESLRRHEAEITSLLYDRNFRSQFDDILGGVFDEAQNQVSFDLLLNNLGQSLEISDNVAHLKEAADNAYREMLGINENVRAGMRALHEGMNRGFMSMTDHQEAVRQKVDINNAILELTAPPRLRLALADSTGRELDHETRVALERRVNAEDIGQLGRHFNAASSALLSSGLLDDQTAAAVADATRLADAGFGLATALADPTGIGLALNVMNMVGVFNGFGQRGGPGAEVQLLTELKQELKQIRSDMRKFHEKQMNLLNDIRDDVESLREEMHLRFDEINERLVFVQLGTQELLEGYLHSCTAFDSLVVDRPYRDDRFSSLEGFERWWVSQHIAHRYRVCGDELERLLFDPWDAEGRISRIFFAVLEDANIQRDSTAAEREARAFRDTVLRPTLRYTATHLDRTRNEDWLWRNYAPSSKWFAEEAKRDAWPGAEQWQPSRLWNESVDSVFGEVLVAERIAQVSHWVRALTQVNGLLIGDVGGPRPITPEDLGKGSIRVPVEAMSKLIDRAEEHVRAGIAQEHLLAGTLMVNQAANALSEDILPTYAHARRTGDWESFDQMMEPAGTTLGDMENCATGELPYDTLCLMQRNLLFAENVLRVLVALRLENNHSNLRMYELAQLAADGGPLRVVLGKDLRFSDALDPAVFPGVFEAAMGQESADGKAPSPVWAIELPRVISGDEIVRSDREERNAFSVSLIGADRCWGDRARAGTAKQSRRDITREWPRCYVLPRAHELIASELRMRPQFDGLTNALRRLYVARAYQVDPRSLPEGMKEMIAIANWSRSDNPDAVRYQERD